MMRGTVASQTQVLDYLQVLFPDSSRTTLRQMLQADRVRVNGKLEKNARRDLDPGDTVDVAPRAQPQLIPPEVAVLFEDEDIIVIFKEVGLLTVSAPGEVQRTAQAFLNDYLSARKIRERIHVSLTNSVIENIRQMAEAFKRDVEDLTIVVLDRERHQDLIGQIREAGARIKLISDGDLSGGIAAAVRGTSIHGLMGIGGAPEGVLTAAAMRCLNGRMQGRLKPLEKWQEERLRSMGFRDSNKIYETAELASGQDIIFSATGVTDGDLLRGVRFFGGGIRTSSLFMSLKTNTIRFVDTIYKDTDATDLAVSFQ